MYIFRAGFGGVGFRRWDLDILKMSSLGESRRRRFFVVENLVLKSIDFMKKIDEKRPLKPQNFLGAFGADSYTYLVHPIDYLNPPPLLTNLIH